MQKLTCVYADSEGPDQTVQSDQGLCCRLTKSFNTIECFNGEQMPRHQENMPM